MIYWLLIIILSYFFFSLSYLGDKLILSGPPKPIAYTFYVGFTGIFSILLIPFVHLQIPDTTTAMYIIADALIYIVGLYVMYNAIEKFDVSRVMTTIGAIQPITIFILTYIVWGPQLLSRTNILAFILLFVGSVLISAEKNFKAGASYLKLTMIAAILFSLDYIFSKMIFLSQPFLEGFIEVRLTIFIFALFFLLFKKNRKEIFSKENTHNKKLELLFLGNQASGGLANFLQYFAISLTPVAFLPILNSLRGIQYVFLFLLTLFFSLAFPKILKEKISRSAILQKVVSIILISAGLALLVL